MTISDCFQKGPLFCSTNDLTSIKPALWPALTYSVEILCFTNIGMDL